MNKKEDSIANLTICTVNTENTMLNSENLSLNLQSKNFIAENKPKNNTTINYNKIGSSTNDTNPSCKINEEEIEEKINLLNECKKNDNHNNQVDTQINIFDYFEDIRCFTVFMCLIVMLINALTVGYRSSVVTTIEKRFEFSSVFSGVLSGCLEVGSLTTTLLVSYFGSKSHIPRLIAVSSIFCAIGSILYALPHLLSGSYTIHNQVMNKTTNDLICKQVSNTKFDQLVKVSKESIQNLSLVSFNLTNVDHQLNSPKLGVISFLDRFEINPKCLLKPSNYGIFAILIMSNVLIGSSSAPLYTLGTTYIDNHVSKENSSIYLGFMYSMLAFGPVVGYLVGAALLQVYVDGIHFSAEKLNIDPSDSTWVGAWYVGFVLFSILIFLTSFTFFCFPKEIKKNRNVITTEFEKEDENTFGDLKTFPKAIKNLLTNRVFMIVTIAFCFEITIISGFLTFLPKFIENQFNVNNSVANIYTGGIAIPGACIGIVLGGFLVKRFKIDPKGAAKMAIICNIFCSIGIFILIFLGCPNIKMAGTTVSYNSNDLVNMDGHQLIFKINLTSNCNQDCQCSSSFIEPICGINGITYFSPCHAGCKEYKTKYSSNEFEISKKKFSTYSSCKCIINDLQNSSLPLKNSEINAESGVCQTKCNMMAPFLIILFSITLLTALNQMPMLMVTLRSVTEIERPFALGLQLVILRLLAYIPSPLIFGRSIDSTCLVWRKDECEQTGSCLFYDKETFRHIYGSIAAVNKGVSLFMFVILYMAVRKLNFKEKQIEIADMMKNSTNSLNTIHYNSKKKTHINENKN